MKYKRCGNSGVKLPIVSLGLWQNFGDVNDFSISKEIILKAFDLGIVHFDLANNYGPPPGSAETNFGKILEEELAVHRDELFISSKAGYYMWPGPYGEWGSKKSLIASLDQSLKRMQLEYVDLFYHHRPDPDTPLEETMSALDLIVRQGKALYVGISNYDHIQTEKALKILSELGTPCLINQVKYNMFNRWIEPDLLSIMKNNKIGCISFSPLAQGLLSDKYLNGIPKSSRVKKGVGFLSEVHITQDKLNRIIKLQSIAEECGMSIAQLALSWNLRHEEMTSVLIGASSIEQIEENAKIAKFPPLSQIVCKRIDSILS